MRSIKKCGFCSNFVPLGSPVIESVDGGIVRFCTAKCFLAYCEHESKDHKHDPRWDSLCNKAIERGLKENPGLSLEEATDSQILSWVSLYSSDGDPGGAAYS